MDAEVPGGQQAFVGPDNKLSWTVPHSGNIPEGSTTTGFRYTPPASEGQVGELTLDGFDGWSACPVTADDGSVDYEIGAVCKGEVLPSECYGVVLGATPFKNSPAAWEYI